MTEHVAQLSTTVKGLPAVFVEGWANDIPARVAHHAPMADEPTQIHASKQPRRPHFIAEWMELRQVSQADLARDLGVDKSVVSRWLSGTSPGRENQERLNAYFGIEDREGIFRHPDDDWLARQLRGLNRDEREQAKRIFESVVQNIRRSA